MSQLKIDKRTLEDILEQIKSKALAYTPEWRFDLENKDAGTALAVIYAEMLKNTISRLNNVPEKNKIAFYNKIGADIKPAIPAEGYVTFDLINDEVSGSQVPRSTQLFADVESKDRVVFETIDDVFVSASRPEKIFMVSRERDYFAKIYDEEQDGERNHLNQCEVRLFEYKKDNLQRHTFYISHPSVFHIRTEGEIILDIRTSPRETLGKEVKKALLDSDNTKFEYLTEDGYIAFTQVKFEGDCLVLYKTKEMKPFVRTEDNRVDETEPVWNDYIRCTVKDIHLLEKIQIDKIYIRSRGKMIPPELVVAGENEYKESKFYAFGERPTVMQELYFVSEEVLSKKGAFIHLNFDLEYGKFEIENQAPDREYNWKNIMKKSDFNVDPEYDITISQVVWEYYNGTGWTRLFPTEMYQDIFHAETESFRNITINFQCPEDIEPFLVNSVTSYSIRARIMKMNNLFKMKGYYISPCISRVRFKYEYINNTIPPYQLRTENNLEVREYAGSVFRQKNNMISLFEGVIEEKNSIFVGFRKPLINGPLKFLFIMKNTILDELPVLHYQYWNGSKWCELNLVDKTENFRKTGILTMMGNEEIAAKTLFGETLYWIKISDIQGGYRDGKAKKPVITGIHINTTGVKSVETREPEYFDIRAHEENLECHLLGNNIHRIDVWVDEKSEINDVDMHQLESDNMIRYEYTLDGEISNIWVKWKKVPEFDSSMMDERVYTADFIHGIVRFSDGKCGKIPTTGDNPTIKVEYSCGGGKVCNVEPGQIDKLNRTIGFIGQVINYDRAAGGCDQETIDEAIHRNARKLRHGYRAVTTTDYEDLAMEANRNIIKAKCCANCKANGEKEYGYITLVLLQREYERGTGYFDQLRETVEKYLANYMNEMLIEQGRFQIVEPEYVVMNVNISVAIKDYNKVFEVREKIEHCIKKYLNAVDGNFDGKGWNIGESPNENQIQNAVKEIKEISYIKNVRIDAYRRENEGKVLVDYEKLKQYPFVLPLSGEHKINIDVE